MSPRGWLLRVAASALALAALISCVGEDSESISEPAALSPPSSLATPDDPIEPIPLELDLDARKVALGERLFRDTILSPDDGAACTTCHELGRGGVDGRKTSHLPDHPAMVVNTPTVFNVGYNFRLHWGGAWTTLEEQLTTPIESPRALATKVALTAAKLRASPEYGPAFSAIYSEGATERTLRATLAEYERSLVTPNARFDRYLRGAEDALTADEIAGYQLFKSHGCISCHQGMNIGGNMFQKLGTLREYFAERGHVTDADLGRFNVTKREQDRHVFRVPSLRNVAVTGPYLHDGSAETLEEVVQIMSQYQLGRSLTSEQVRLLVAFLGTLTGEYKGQLLQ